MAVGRNHSVNSASSEVLARLPEREATNRQVGLCATSAGGVCWDWGPGPRQPQVWAVAARSPTVRRGPARRAKDKGSPVAGADPDNSPQIRLIGDGSTADTGPQPHQPAKPVRLEPGEMPPQFVIFSWDGAGEVGNGLFPALSETRRGTQRGDDLLPLGSVPAARVEEGACTARRTTPSVPPRSVISPMSTSGRQ